MAEKYQSKKQLLSSVPLTTIPTGINGSFKIKDNELK